MISHGIQSKFSLTSLQSFSSLAEKHILMQSDTSIYVRFRSAVSVWSKLNLFPLRRKRKKSFRMDIGEALVHAITDYYILFLFSFTWLRFSASLFNCDGIIKL